MIENSIDLKSKLVVKAVRNVRGGFKKEDASRGMYRQGIKIDVDRARLITESYKMTEGEPIIIRRAKFLDHYLSNLPIHIYPWERIVGNFSDRKRLYFPIDMNWSSVSRVINSREGEILLDEAERAEMEKYFEYWKGKSMSDLSKHLFGEELKKYQKIGNTPFFWTQWSELGVPNYEKLLEKGLNGIIKEVEDKLEEVEKEVPHDYVEQKEFLLSVLISLNALIKFATRYSNHALDLAKSDNIEEDYRKRLIEIAETCKRVPKHPPRTFLEAIQFFYFIHLVRYIEYSTLGIGIRFDKVFGPYYKKDLGNGDISRSEALELLQMLC